MTPFLTNRTILPATLLLLALAVSFPAAAPAVEIVFNEACFPSCDTRDGRLLIMAGGPGLETRSDTPLNLKFHVEQSAVAAPADPSFTIDIFDGDTLLCSNEGVCDPYAAIGEPHWDVGLPVQAQFTLYAVQEQPDGSSVLVLVDPAKIELGGGSVVSSNPFFGGDMFDDDWFRVRVTVGDEARTTTDGDYRYQLRIELDPTYTFAPKTGTLNGMKIRTSASLLMSRVEQPFAFEAKWTNLHDLKLVYPNFDMANLYDPSNLAGAKYDGTFTFSFYIPPGQPGNPRTELTLFDADLDHGNWSGTIVDRDDPDTSPNLADLPFPTGAEVRSEGANDAAPFDDQSPTGVGLYLTRTPAGVIDPSNPVESAVTYRVVFPPNTDPGAIVCRAGDSQPGPEIDGRKTIENLNPSGNREWEAFTLSTAAFDGSVMDCHVDTIPSGVYRVDLIGMDMNNLNAWYFAGDVCGVLPDGTPRCTAGAFKIGDTVWEDTDVDGNGSPAEIAADGESGIPGVIMILRDASGNEMARTITGADGYYEFDVPAGEFSVRVASENFSGASTGGAIGDRVWLDADGDGNQDAGEPGLNGIEVLLFSAGADGGVGGGDDSVVASTRTSGDGEYLFADLPSGSYYTAIADGGEPEGLVLSGGSDPSAVRVITGSETHLDLDFGYTNAAAGTAIIGDFVWHDLDGDGSQDVGEPGIDGVTVTLRDDTGAVVAKAVTSGGYYLFTGVAPGVYQVDVTDELGALTGYTLTTANDPTALFSVSAGGAVLDKDFGYDNNGLYSISDVVWLDTDRDGIQDVGESGIAGVTVALVGAQGAVLATATTASDGSFSFDGLPDGAYSLLVTDFGGALSGLLPTTGPALAGSTGANVEGASVSAVSFGYVSGGALTDLRATTASPEITNTVVDANIMTYDFGYAPLGAACDIGRPTSLVFEYTGESCSSPDADNNRQTQDSCTGPLDGNEPVQIVMTAKPERFIVDPSTETINVGDLFSISAATQGSLMWPNTQISIRQGGVEIQNVILHTSCSEPLDPGDQFGSLILRSYIFPDQGASAFTQTDPGQAVTQGKKGR